MIPAGKTMKCALIWTLPRYKYDMSPTNDLLFATLDHIPILDKALAAKEILALPDSESMWDDYRYTKIFVLMASTPNNSFVWTGLAPQVIIDWCENHMFPWMGEKTSVLILVTQPGVANHEHFDCKKEALNTRQHKLRIVLQGKTSTLYWLTDQGRIPAPEVDGPFIMDGGWPHGMTNTTNETKLTLVFGAPWTGKDHYDDVTVLQRRSQYKMPDEIDHLWNTNV